MLRRRSAGLSVTPAAQTQVLDADLVERGLATLSEAHREVVTRAYLKDESYTDIALGLGVPGRHRPHPGLLRLARLAPRHDGGGAVSGHPCPERLLLPEALAGRLDPPEEKRVMAHVEGCAACQEVAVDIEVSLISLAVLRDELEHPVLVGAGVAETGPRDVADVGRGAVSGAGAQQESVRRRYIGRIAILRLKARRRE